MEIGCILLTLSGEISRLSEEVRQAYTRELQRFMRFISDMAGVDACTGYALVSSMVGTVALARAVSEPKLGDDLLLAGKIQAKQIIEASIG